MLRPGEVSTGITVGAVGSLQLAYDNRVGSDDRVGNKNGINNSTPR